MPFIARTAFSMPITLLVALLGGCMCINSVPETPGNAPIESQVDEIRIRSTTPATSYVVVRDLTIIATGTLGFSNLEAQSPNSPDLAFQLASVSKLFTAQAIMQLTHREDFSLDDPVSRWIPDMTNSPVSIRQLLTHTSGLRDKSHANHRSTQAEIEAEIRKIARSLPENAHPYDWNYSDASFNLLGAIIERISGTPYSEYLREYIFIPLSMQSSNAAPNTSPPNPKYYTPCLLGGIKPIEHPYDGAFAPSSGVQSSANDIARWMIAVLKRDPLTGLEPEEWAAMWKAHTQTGWYGIDQGLAWQIEKYPDTRRLRHAGQEHGVASLLTLYPELNAGIFIVGNCDSLARFEIRTLLEQAYLPIQKNNPMP